MVPFDRPLSRREMFRLSAAGVSAVSCSGWLGQLAAHAQTAPPPSRPKACILLWMDGGPAHMDTFDLKPDAPDTHRGGYRPISTSLTGVHITEGFPRLSRHMHRACVLRGMKTEEAAEHVRARVYMHTGFRPGAGGLEYPSLGALVAAHRPEATGIPNFVVTGQTMLNGAFPYVAGAGYVGPRHRGLILREPAQGIENARPLADDFDDRLALVRRMSTAFQRTAPGRVIEAQQAALDNAVQLMRSSRSRAFDLEREPSKVRDRYGRGTFGQGCLLARRLVEEGVPFVEAYLGDWDTHEQRRADLVRDSLMPQTDLATSSLLEDLDSRGLLDSTLVIWMGEFGRTPRVRGDGARDHYVRAWSSVLFGGGIRAGQVIGRTDALGAEVVDRPISGPDFLATILTILGIRPTGTLLAPGDRPVHIVERGFNVISEVLGD